MKRNVLTVLNSLILLACLAGVAVLIEKERRVVAGPPADAKYVGQQVCRTCHFRDFRSWKKHKHAGAWDVLEEKDRERSRCQQCHVTGFGKTGGYVSEEATPHLTGVQCEACHGPGSAHVEVAKVEEDEDKIDALINRIPQNTCVECHNPHKTHEEYEKDSAK